MIEEIPSSALRHDARGDLLDLGSFSPEGLHVVSLIAGATRGNHVHDRDEIVCVIGGGGKCEMEVEDETSRERRRLVVEGNLKTYRIKAGIKHTIRNLGPEPFYLVCFHETPPTTR